MAMAGTLANTARKTVKVEKPEDKMKKYVQSMSGEIAKALPSVMTPERFTRIVLSTLSSNPKLAQCTPNSFLASMMTAAQLGVEPNTPLGQAYLIPYRNHGTMECQFQIGYKGLIDLAYRSGEVTLVQAHEVCENDDFTYSFGLNPDLHHIPATGERGEVTYYYAIWKGKNGGFGFEVMSREDVEKHGKRFSKSYNNSPWQTNFDEMAKKTVLKKALKYAPMKTDFVTAVVSDETIKHDISPEMWSVESVQVDEPQDDVVAEVQPNEMEVESQADKQVSMDG